MGASEILRMNDLKIGYGDRVIAGPFDIALQKGIITALIGRNGIGKSTLLKTLTGNLRPIQGKVLIEGTELTRIKKADLAKKIAIVSHSESYIGGLRLHELVGLGRTPYTGTLGIMSRNDKEKISESMERVGILSLSDKFVGELSDGERQKGMIARALAQETPIIIMDEPFSFLDVAARIEILLLLKGIAEKDNKAILFSTHEVTQALRMTQTIWLFTNASENSYPQLHAGPHSELIEKGILDSLFNSELIKFDKNTKDFIVNTK